MSLHPFDTRRYVEFTALISTAARKFNQMSNLVIEELEYRKRKRIKIMYFIADTEEVAKELAEHKGYRVLSAEFFKDEHWKVTVLD